MRRGGTARCKGEGKICTASVRGRERWSKGGRERKRDREGESESGWLARRTRRCTTLSEKVRSRVRTSSWTCSPESKDVRPESSFERNKRSCTTRSRKFFFSKDQIEARDKLWRPLLAVDLFRLKGDGSERRIITLLRFDCNDEVIGDRRGILAGSQKS